MLADRVKCTVANPGSVAVSSTISLGATPTGYRSWLAAFGATASAYFVLSDGLGRTITGVWTVNSGGTATITEILWNDRLESTAGETFSSTCTAWCAQPAREVPTLRSSPLAGFRNLIINGNPIINQRAYVSGTATSGANQYTLDRWRVVTSGQAVSWTDSAGIRTVTAPAGGMEQVIEGLGLIGGTYTLNWTGGATATVGGASVAKGAQVTLAGGTDVTVRMSNGTWSLLQLEPGPIASPFERRPYPLELAMCQRFACTVPVGLQVPAIGSGLAPWFAPVPMRITPTLAVLIAGTATSVSAAVDLVYNNQGGTFQITATAANGSVVGRVYLLTAEF